MATVEGCLADILNWLRLIGRSDQELRQIQADQAPKASYYDQPTGGVASPTVYTIEEALTRSEIFSTLVIVFEATSGLGRFRVDNTPATPTVGNQIPAGASTLTINGMDSIKGFSMVGEAAATLVFARQLYK